VGSGVRKTTHSLKHFLICLTATGTLIAPDGCVIPPEHTGDRRVRRVPGLELVNGHWMWIFSGQAEALARESRWQESEAGVGRDYRGGATRSPKTRPIGIGDGRQSLSDRCRQAKLVDNAASRLMPAAYMQRGGYPCLSYQLLRSECGTPGYS
jgi:hypothetical protein